MLKERGVIIEMRVVLRRILLTCILLFLILFFVRHYDGKEYASGEEQEFINSACKMSGVPALSVGLWDKDKDIFLNYSDEGISADENSLYELASTTKAFTGLAILQLKEKGLLSFDDPVQKYIPEFRPTLQGQEKKITIRQLLNHSSGIPSYSLDLIPEEAYHAGGLAQSLSALMSVRLNKEPGTEHEYSTVNYDLLALILERITGMGYEEYERKNILDPLGMKDSFFRSEEKQAGVMQGYKSLFSFSLPYNAPVYYGNTAAGYLISDTKDLMKWMRNVKQLFVFSSFPIDRENIYFAGWNIRQGIVSHSGNNPNYSAHVCIDRNEDLGVFVLSAKNSDAAFLVADGIFRMHKGETVTLGIQIHLFEILDLLFTLVPLFLVWLLLLVPADTKKKAVIYFAVGLVLLASFMIFPFVSPISYGYCLVWFPFSLIFFMAMMIISALYMIVRSMINMKKLSESKTGESEK